jgi:hypothetical protein
MIHAIVFKQNISEYVASHNLSTRMSLFAAPDVVRVTMLLAALAETSFQ